MGIALNKGMRTAQTIEQNKKIKKKIAMVAALGVLLFCEPLLIQAAYYLKIFSMPLPEEQIEETLRSVERKKEFKAFNREELEAKLKKAHKSIHGKELPQSYISE